MAFFYSSSKSHSCLHQGLGHAVPSTGGALPPTLVLASSHVSFMTQLKHYFLREAPALSDEAPLLYTLMLWGAINLQYLSYKQLKRFS